MRHLLLSFLSLLLLYSFLISCEKKEETLYQWKTSSGNEWKEIGDKETQIKYRGFVDDGSPEGLGVMTFPDGRKYVGEFKDGEKHGQGTFTLPDGSVYVGEFRKNKPWNGKMYYKNGNIIGKFVNGIKQ